MFFSRRRRSNLNASVLFSKACCEMLESRRLLAATTITWSGAGPDTLFSDAANWKGGVVPTAANNVDFPNGVAATTVTVDTNVTVINMEFDNTYTLNSPAAGPTTITLDGNLDSSLGITVVNNPIILTQNTFALVYEGAGLTLAGTVSDGGSGFGITQTGNGALILTGTGDTYTGNTVADGGSIVDTATSLTSNVIIFPGCNFYGSGSINELAGDGGTYAAVNGSAAGTVTIADGLSLAANSGNKLAFDLGSPSSQFVVNSGTITLGNAAFSATVLAGFMPSASTPVTLIANNTGVPVVGTFANLPQGASVVIGTETYTISYTGGLGGEDVTLTAVASPSTTTLTAKKTPIIEGEYETFVARVIGSDGTLASGTVTFYDNTVPLTYNFQTAQPLANGVVAIAVTNLPTGTNNIIATYDGEGIHALSSSTPVTVTVRSGTDPIVIGLESTTTASTHGFTIGATIYASDSTSEVLTYSWTVLHVPSGAKTPAFAPNNNNAAETVTARFYKDGGYVLQCKVSDPSGNFAYADVDVTVSQKARSFRIQPHKAQIPKDGTQQYTAVALDQFGHPMRTAQTLIYNVESGAASGSIDASGLFSATSVAGAVTIEVEDDLLTGTVSAEVV
jgi:hypothetical protein